MKVKAEIRGVGMYGERVTHVVKNWNFPDDVGRIGNVVRVFELEDVEPFEFLLKEMLNMGAGIMESLSSGSVILGLSADRMEFESDDGGSNLYSEDTFGIEVGYPDGKSIMVEVHANDTHLEAKDIHNLLRGIPLDIDGRTIGDMIKSFYTVVREMLKSGYERLEVTFDFPGDKENREERAFYRRRKRG